MPNAGKVKRATQLEAETVIQPNRRNVVTEHVQKRCFSPLLDSSAQHFHEAASKAIPAIVFIYANGADLNVPVDAHPFAGHRNETSAVANPDVVAHLASPVAERAGPGPSDQIEHICHIRLAQPDDLRLVRTLCFRMRGDHLMDHAHVRHS